MKDIEKRTPNIDDYKLIYDFQYNAIRETAGMLAKGMSFYLAIHAVLFGYVLTRDINEDIKFKATIIGVFVSTAAFFAAGAMAWGIFKGLDSLMKLLKKNNEYLFEELEVQHFITRGKRVLFFVGACSFILLIIFGISIASI